jgi:hypothetical protein
MKRIILRILNLIRNLFNKITDKEAERVIEFYRHVFDSDYKERR